jgi:hypothetical protein
MKVFTSYIKGIKEASRRPKMIVLLWAINFLFASVVYFLISGLFNSAVAPHIDVDQLMNKLDFSVILDFILANGGALSTIISIGLILIFMYFLATHLIYGGILHTLKSGRDSSREGKKPRFMAVFWEGAGKFFFRFLILSVLSILLWLGFLFINLILTPIGGLLTNSGANEQMLVYVFIGRVIIALFLIFLIKMILDYARIQIVSEDNSNVFFSFFQAVGYVFRRLGKTLALFYLILFTGALFFIIVLFLKSLITTTTIGASIMAFIVGQVIIMIREWTTIFFQSSQLEFYSAGTELSVDEE